MSAQEPTTNVPPETTPPEPTTPDPEPTTPDPTPEPTTPEPEPTTPDPEPEPTTTPEPEPEPTEEPDPRTTSTVVTIVTRTPTRSTSTTSSTTSSSATPIGSGGGSGGGLSSSAKIAVAVVVPIAAVALFVFAGIWFYKRRKARREAAEERRKEVEDYSYNPNADPTIPAVGLVSDERYEMRDDGTAGYRGWGSTTAAGSTGRKASTTMSGGVTGVAYSDATSPIRGNVSDTRSGEPLMEGSPQSGTYSPEGEILGAMGPSAAGNRGADVHRGPSNASSSYSAAARSDGSGDAPIGMAYGGGGQYYNQYAGGNPYGPDQPYEGGQGPTELPGQPIIRDNPARRNTRIENPSHYPQQSAGISQNF